MIENLDDLQKLITKLQNREKTLDFNDNRQISPNEHIFVSNGPFLHQNGDTQSEEQSVLFEQQNQRALDALRSIKNDLYKHLEQ